MQLSKRKSKGKRARLRFINRIGGIQNIKDFIKNEEKAKEKRHK